jgi:hypothetical protein
VDAQFDLLATELPVLVRVPPSRRMMVSDKLGIAIVPRNDRPMSSQASLVEQSRSVQKMEMPCAGGSCPYTRCNQADTTRIF